VVSALRRAAWPGRIPTAAQLLDDIGRIAANNFGLYLPVHQPPAALSATAPPLAGAGHCSGDEAPGSRAGDRGLSLADLRISGDGMPSSHRQSCSGATGMGCGVREPAAAWPLLDKGQSQAPPAAPELEAGGSGSPSTSVPACDATTAADAGPGGIRGASGSVEVAAGLAPACSDVHDSAPHGDEAGTGAARRIVPALAEAAPALGSIGGQRASEVGPGGPAVELDPAASQWLAAEPSASVGVSAASVGVVDHPVAGGGPPTGGVGTPPDEDAALRGDGFRAGSGPSSSAGCGLGRDQGLAERAACLERQRRAAREEAVGRELYITASYFNHSWYLVCLSYC
jgi:hypothetical protein